MMNGVLHKGVAMAVAGLCIAGCSRAMPPAPAKGGRAMNMALMSSAFKEGAAIPVKYTGDGLDISPPLAWINVPAGTQAFVLICDDPDAPVGTWVHWVLYDIPGTATNLPERVASTPTVPGIGTHGVNDFRRLGYGGPAPPPGKPHRYFFKLYALDAPTGLASGRSKRDLLHAINGHILAKAQLMGTYKR